MSKPASSTILHSGRGGAVDGSAQQSSHEDDYSDDDEYDDDDWKRIEDPGERRKIQNRFAQRKFRKLIPLFPDCVSQPPNLVGHMSHLNF
jgi:hypothetical protein